MAILRVYRTKLRTVYNVQVDEDMAEKFGRTRLSILMGSGSVPYCYITHRGRRIALARVILGGEALDTKAVAVDHINRDPLDNRRENLRICSRSANVRNRVVKRRKNGPCVYPGVYKETAKNGAVRWRYRLTVEGVLVARGACSTEAEAIAAKKEAEVKYGMVWAEVNGSMYLKNLGSLPAAH